MSRAGGHKQAGDRFGRNDDHPGRFEALLAALQEISLHPIQRAYAEDRWIDQLVHLGRGASTARRFYYGFRLMAILGGVLIPALIGLNVEGDRAEYVGWLTFGLGLLVAAAVAIEEFFRFGERWRHYRHAAEVLHSEGWAFLALAGPAYRRFTTHAEAFPAFAARCEEAMRQEVGAYITQVIHDPEAAKAGGTGKSDPGKDASPKEGEG